MKNIFTNSQKIKVLYITTEWEEAPFIKQQVEKLNESGISTHIFKLKAGGKLVNYLTDRIRLRKKIKEEKFNIVHAHYGQSGFISKFKNIPLVTTFHGSDSIGLIGERGKYTFKGKLLKFMSKITSHISQKNIFVSNEAANSLGVSKNFEVIPCGIDTSIFKPLDKDECRKILGLDNKRYVLFCGNPDVKVKNYDLALKSFKKLEINFGFPVEMLPLRGYKHNEIPILLNAIDVLLMTSHHEGSPMIIKEALSCNTPIVSLDVGDVKERLMNIEGCYVIKNKLKNDIASALLSALKNNVEINSRAHVLNLDLVHINQQILNLYESILRG